MGMNLARQMDFPLEIMNQLHLGNVEGVLIRIDDGEELSSSKIFYLGNYGWTLD